MKSKNQIFTALAVIIVVLAAASPADADPLLSSVTVGPQSPGQLNPGDSATYTITVGRTGKGNMEIYLTASGLPAGAVATFSPSPLAFTGSTPVSETATLTISTSPSTPVGVFLFTVTARDGNSPNATNNVGTLTVGGINPVTPQPSTMSSVTLLGNGTANVQASGMPGQSYIVQATASLAPAAWTNVGTNTAGTDGRLAFIDHDAANYPSRFYRLMLGH